MPPIEADCLDSALLLAALLSPDVPTPAIVEGQLQASRVAQAGAAIAVLVQEHGLTTVGDLLAALGIESVPRLLAMLGFTGDLEGLAREIACDPALSTVEGERPVRDSA